MQPGFEMIEQVRPQRLLVLTHRDTVDSRHLIPLELPARIKQQLTREQTEEVIKYLVPVLADSLSDAIPTESAYRPSLITFDSEVTPPPRPNGNDEPRTPSRKEHSSGNSESHETPDTRQPAHNHSRTKNARANHPGV